MKTLIKAFAVTTAMTTSTLVPMQAHAEIETLAECYQAVITWCNETYPEMDCSNSSGLDDCDEVFGDNAATRIDNIFVQTWSDGTKTLRFEWSEVEEEDEDDERRPERERDNDDEDRDDDRERPEREPTRSTEDHSAGDEHEITYDIAAGV